MNQNSDLMFLCGKKWETLADVSYLGIITIEHDSLSKAVPKIPKGTDGRALQ